MIFSKKKHISIFLNMSLTFFYPGMNWLDTVMRSHDAFDKELAKIFSSLWKLYYELKFIL